MDDVNVFFPGKVEIRRELEHAGAKWRSYGSRYCQVDAIIQGSQEIRH